MVNVQCRFTIVGRFHLPIDTKEKLDALTKITVEDCRTIEDLMRRYSADKHSQPEEAPVGVPEFDTLAADIDKLAQWIADFDKRPTPLSS